MSYVYVKSERVVPAGGYVSYLYTTGFYDPAGNFVTDDDFPDRKEARARVHYLNGGTMEEAHRIASAVEGLERRPA